MSRLTEVQSLKNDCDCVAEWCALGVVSRLYTDLHIGWKCYSYQNAFARYCAKCEDRLYVRLVVTAEANGHFHDYYYSLSGTTGSMSLTLRVAVV